MILKGKKTYATAALAVATAGLSYASGNATAIAALQLAFTGVIGAFLRAGVGEAVNSPA